jgi:hypothetical protein
LNSTWSFNSAAESVLSPFAGAFALHTAGAVEALRWAALRIRAISASTVNSDAWLDSGSARETVIEAEVVTMGEPC